MVFKNIQIYKSIDDYIIGGVTDAQLSMVHTPANGNLLNKDKFEVLFRLRLEQAIEKHLKDTTESISKKGEDSPYQTAISDFNELLKTYLYFSTYENTASALAEKIMNTQQYVAWSNRILSNIKNAESSNIFTGHINEGRANIGENESTISEYVESPTIIEILESLSKYA